MQVVKSCHFDIFSKSCNRINAIPASNTTTPTIEPNSHLLDPSDLIQHVGVEDIADGLSL